uniref:Si:dkey-122a22.2 n=1 Tax=Scleropages formosus TaxID=113540 RepID=A0A8C9VN02_SCLFO
MRRARTNKRHPLILCLSAQPMCFEAPVLPDAQLFCPIIFYFVCLFVSGGLAVDIGLGQKINLVCKGEGQPVVLLDAPTGMSSDAWFHVQEDVSRVTKVCSYDRVGLGFSKRAFQNETTGMERMWRVSTTGRMVDDLHRLIRAANIATPLILAGSELGGLNGRFYSHIHNLDVSDLVLIDPIPEDVFEEDQWRQYWYTQLVPSLQAVQFSAATGLNRMFIILGWMQPAIRGENVSEDLIQRQKYCLSNPSHQSSAVDEHFFLNESVSQVRELSRFKPLSSMTSVSVITGDYFDEQLPAHLNKVVAECQKRFLEQSYPSAKRIHVPGADRTMIYKKHSAVSKHLLKIIEQRQSKQRSQ